MFKNIMYIDKTQHNIFIILKKIHTLNKIRYILQVRNITSKYNNIYIICLIYRNLVRGIYRKLDFKEYMDRIFVYQYVLFEKNSISPS